MVRKINHDKEDNCILNSLIQGRRKNKMHEYMGQVDNFFWCNSVKCEIQVITSIKILGRVYWKRFWMVMFNEGFIQN